MKIKLKTLRTILAVVLILTFLALAVETFLEWLNPGYFGFFFNFIIIIALAIPVFVTEWEAYCIVKYFFVDEDPVKEKIVCKLLSAAFTLVIVANYVMAMFKEGFSLGIVWAMTFLLGGIRIAEWVIDRRKRAQDAWVQEMIAQSDCEH